MSSPPVIRSITITPPFSAEGRELTVIVDWTGATPATVIAQWYDGADRVVGQRSLSWVPAEAPTAANCFVHIDNGFGTASAFSDTAEPEPEVDPEEPQNGFPYTFPFTFAS